MTRTKFQSKVVPIVINLGEVMQAVLVDGLGSVSLVDGVVRLSLVAFAQEQGGAASPKVEQVSSIALSMPALTRFHDQLGDAIQKLIDQGALSRDTPSS